MKKNILRVLCACAILSLVSCQNLLELIGSDSELTQFYKLVQSNETLDRMLREAEVTVFAPTNDAFRKYDPTSGYKGVALPYHVVTSAVTSGQFPAGLPSQLPGGLPVWVTKRKRPSGFLANNAEIIRGDIKGESSAGSEQVLHVIDEVLEPTLPVGEDSNPDFRNPTAFTLLSNLKEFGISDDVTAFHRKLNKSSEIALFEGGNGSTFFLPVDGIDELERWSDEVIEGHVIPEVVLFARAFPREFKMASRGDDVGRVVRLRNELTGYELSIESLTEVRNRKYGGRAEVVRIVKPNLPVQNGVVHLVDRPLFTSGKRVREVIEENAQLSKFRSLLRKYDPGLLDLLERSEMTVFAPSDRAFAKADPAQLERVYNDRKWVKQVLEVHVSPGKLRVKQLFTGSTSIPSLDPSSNLSFRLVNRNLMVLGGGASAVIVQPDVSATNGVVHVIDDVLGLPFRSIYRKLQADETLSQSLELGEQRKFNDKFRKCEQSYTYFVPNDEAWLKLKTRFPVEHAQLFGGWFGAHARKLLERHVVKGWLPEVPSDGATVDSLNGKIDFRWIDGRKYVRWEELMAEVVEAEVIAENGRVYVINDVLFKPSDLTSGSSNTFRDLFRKLLTSLMF